MNSANRMLRPYIQKEWPALLGSTGSTILMSAADLASPWPLALALDHLLRGHKHSFALSRGDIRYLGFLALAVVAISTVNAGASFLSDWWLVRAGERITHELRVAVYAHLHNLSLDFHGGRQKGDLVTSVTADVNAIGDFFSGNLGDFAQSSLLVLGMMAVTLYKDPIMGVVAFVTIPLVAVLSLRYRRTLARHSRLQRVQDGKIASLATEALSAMPVIKAFGSERFEHDRVWLRSHRRLAIGMALARLEATFDGVTTMLGAVGIALVLVVGVFRVASGAITAGELIVFAAYARRINSPLRSIARDVTKAGIVGARSERVAQILAADERLPEPADAYHGAQARGDIELESVAFSYDPARPVLTDLSLKIAAGDRCALMGPSGAGKSTVGALIARFYDPSAGQVRIDGRDLRTCSLAWLREQIGVLLQDTVLFTGTVRENIAYGLSVTLEEVTVAAQAAAAHDFIQALPQGYETRLGPQGVGLSGGQRQRIGIARTLLRDPPILLLDEPTTGLDRATEVLLLESLTTLMKGRTTILISHSPELIRTADRVVVIAAGRIVADGRPDDVLAEVELLDETEEELRAPHLPPAPDSPALAAPRHTQPTGSHLPPWS
jgi:ATP-binding cassette subfamily B protein/subfamily B ATP-binding cassette protein MsbA